MRQQFVVDKKTSRIIKQFAPDFGGNRSAVVREAIRSYAEREAYLDAIENDPGFIAMMQRSDEDFRSGRFVTHDEVKRQIEEAKKKKRKR